MAVTELVAASAVPPLTVGGQLDLFFAPAPGHFADDGTPASGGPQPGSTTTEANRIADALGLLATLPGTGDVVLRTAPDPVVLLDTRQVEGVTHVAAGQVVLDCLGGPGRSPAAAEEVLRAMQADAGWWRAPDLDAWASTWPPGW